MIRLLLIVAVLLAAACDQFPNNPSNEPNLRSVKIEHTGTEYIDTHSDIEGILATKVNILQFHITAKYFDAEAIEFIGRAQMINGADTTWHSLHFRTDSLCEQMDGSGFDFNRVDHIYPDSSYDLMRPKFPPNEFSPFQGNQGKIVSVEITGAWACNGDGESTEIPVQ